MGRLTIDNFCYTLTVPLSSTGIDTIFFTTSFERVNESDMSGSVFVVPIPRRWAIPDRPAEFDCWLPVEFEIWCGVQVSLDTGMNADIETRDDAIEWIVRAIEALENSADIQLTRPDYVETFDFRDGQAINRYAWAKATIQAKFKQT